MEATDHADQVPPPAAAELACGALVRKKAIFIYATAAEHAEAKRRADEAGKTLSQWARDRLLGA
jgi:hypothetical protein